MRVRKKVWFPGLFFVLALALAACGGSDPTATTLPTVTTGPASPSADLSVEEEEYLSAVKDAQLLSVKIFQDFGQIFSQTYPVRGVLLAALLDGGVGTPFIGNLAALEALDPPDRFEDDHRIWLEATRESLRLDTEAAQAVRDGDLVRFVYLNGDLGRTGVKARLALSPIFCRTTATDPQAAANCVPEGQVLTDEYLIGLNNLLRDFMPEFASARGTLGFRLSLTPEELGEVLASMGAAVLDAGHAVQSDLGTMTPPDELLADHERVETHFDEVVAAMEEVIRLQEGGDVNEARLELQRVDQPYCETRQSLVSDDFKAAVGVFFAGATGVCEGAPY